MNKQNLREAMDRRLSSLKTEQRHIDYVMSAAIGEENMTKKHTVSLALVIAIIAVAGIALAAMLSPTIDFFSSIYGKETEESKRYEQDLKGGIQMPVNQSWTLGQVQYDWADVIYVEKSQDNSLKDSTLYGTVIISPVKGENIVLKMEDYDVKDPYGYNPFHGQEVPKDAKSIAHVAEEKGAKIIQPKAFPVKLLVDGNPFEEEFGGEFGYLPDGRISYSFAIRVPLAKSYTIDMRLSNWEVLPDGIWLREEPNNTWLTEVKQVTVETGQSAQ